MSVSRAGTAATSRVFREPANVFELLRNKCAERAKWRDSEWTRRVAEGGMSRWEAERAETRRLEVAKESRSLYRDLADVMRPFDVSHAEARSCARPLVDDDDVELPEGERLVAESGVAGDAASSFQGQAPAGGRWHAVKTAVQAKKASWYFGTYRVKSMLTQVELLRSALHDFSDAFYRSRCEVRGKALNLGTLPEKVQKLHDSLSHVHILLLRG